MKNTSQFQMPTVDDVVSSLKERNLHEIKHWGKENLSGLLGAVVGLNYDGRSVNRNWELIHKLEKDNRLTVTYKKGKTHFADVVVSLVDNNNG